MKENKHQSELIRIFKLAGKLPDKIEPSMKTEMARQAFQLATELYDMSDPINRSMMSEYIVSKGLIDQQKIGQLLDGGFQNTFIIMLSEIENIFSGVSIHVRDRELVEALLRTDIEAVVKDVQFPYPVMEICLPEGIDMGDGYQASSVVFIDYRSANFRKQYSKVIPFGDNPEGSIMSSFIAVTRMRKMDGTYGEVLIKKFDESFDLSRGGSQPDMTKQEDDLMDRHINLVMALMLYLQSVETAKALTPLAHEYSMGEGLPASVARLQKKRRHMAIVDLAAPKKEHGQWLGGTHASPEGHWRKGHIRVFRSEYFSAERRAKPKWIRPMWVGPEGISRGERSI
jgi:hypothetical protein